MDEIYTVDPELSQLLNHAHNFTDSGITIPSDYCLRVVRVSKEIGRENQGCVEIENKYPKLIQEFKNSSKIDVHLGVGLTSWMYDLPLLIGTIVDGGFQSIQTELRQNVSKQLAMLLKGCIRESNAYFKEVEKLDATVIETLVNLGNLNSSFPNLDLASLQNFDQTILGAPNKIEKSAIRVMRQDSIAILKPEEFRVFQLTFSNCFNVAGRLKDHVR